MDRSYGIPPCFLACAPDGYHLDGHPAGGVEELPRVPPLGRASGSQAATDSRGPQEGSSV
eukprot:8758742-Lingulodinium_polyedra.AAC.1